MYELLLFHTVQKDLFTNKPVKKGYIFIFIGGILREAIEVPTDSLRFFYKYLSENKAWDIEIRYKQKGVSLKFSESTWRQVVGPELKRLCNGTIYYNRIKQLFQ